MRIVLINSVCGVGSTGRICTDIAEVLKKSGHECVVAYGRGNAALKFREISFKIGNSIGILKNIINARIFDNEGFNAKKQTEIFIKWLEYYNPDIIHIHNLHGYYINVKILFDYIKKYNKKVIWTLHDCWAFTGHCSHYTYCKCEKWKKKCYNCEQIKEYPRSLYFDSSKNNYAVKKETFLGVKNLTIITPSIWLKKQVEESFLKEYPIYTINNGIDLDIFTSIKKKIFLKKKIVLGVAGVWDERKGIYDFCRLAEMLDERYEIVMVGIKKEQKKKLHKRIITIEHTDTVEELVSLYSSAYVLFNPTYEDTYPTVNLEAQACGLPVITYRIGGSIETVPKQNIVEAGDLVAVIKLLDSDLCVGDYYRSREKMLKEYLKCYEK